MATVRQLVRHRRTPSISDMDTPLSFYTGTAVPDTHRGFDIHLAPLCEKWAKIQYGAGSYSESGTPDKAEVAHAVTVRYEDQPIHKNAYVVMDNIVCRVVEATPLGIRKEFILIYIIEMADMATADVTFLASEDQLPEDGTPSSTEPTNDDLWSDGY